MNGKKIARAAGAAAATAVGVCVGACAGACALVAPRRGVPVLDQRWRELARYRYAHRGLHGPDAPENSIAAFKLARDRGFGVELDVHLTADGQLAVIHDSDISRMCGRAGTVEQMTMAELRECKLAGSAEAIPAFEDALAVFECDPTGELPPAPPIIVEMKTSGANFAELCEKVVAALDDHVVRYCVESFDPRAVCWLKRERPDVIRGQLAENFWPDGERPLHVRVGGTLLLGNVAARPDFIAYKFADRRVPMLGLSCGLLGAHYVGWTIRCQEDLDACEAAGGIAIFEGFIPE